jgi:hypothetical protein
VFFVITSSPALHDLVDYFGPEVSASVVNREHAVDHKRKRHGKTLIWVGAQNLMPLVGIPPNATGLVFGKAVQDNLGIWAYFLGTAIHFVYAIAWGVLFAAIWPYFRRRGYEATFIALFYAIIRNVDGAAFRGEIRPTAHSPLNAPCPSPAGTQWPLRSAEHVRELTSASQKNPPTTSAIEITFLITIAL